MRSQSPEVNLKRRAGLFGDVGTGITNRVDAGNGTITLTW
jgi:hypothetical protein